MNDRDNIAIWRVKAADSKVDQWLSQWSEVSNERISKVRGKTCAVVVADGRGSPEERKMTWAVTSRSTAEEL